MPIEPPSFPLGQGRYFVRFFELNGSVRGQWELAGISVDGGLVAFLDVYKGQIWTGLDC